MDPSKLVPTIHALMLEMGAERFVLGDGLVTSVALQDFGPQGTAYVLHVDGKPHIVIPQTELLPLGETARFEPFVWRVLHQLLTQNRLLNNEDVSRAVEYCATLPNEIRQVYLDMENTKREVTLAVQTLTAMKSSYDSLRQENEALSRDVTTLRHENAALRTTMSTLLEDQEMRTSEQLQLKLELLGMKEKLVAMEEWRLQMQGFMRNASTSNTVSKLEPEPTVTLKDKAESWLRSVGFEKSTSGKWNGLEATIKASAEGNVEVLQWLQSVSLLAPTQKTDQGTTALHVAASNGQLEVLKWFNSERLLDAHAKDGVGYTFSHRAAQHGHLEVLKWLHTLGFDSEGLTWGILATRRGFADVVQWLYTNSLLKFNDYTATNGGNVGAIAATAAHNGRTNILEWMHGLRLLTPLLRRNIGSSSQPLGYYAASNNKLNTFKWLHLNGLLENSFYNGSLTFTLSPDCAQYLAEVKKNRTTPKTLFGYSLA